MPLQKKAAKAQAKKGCIYYTPPLSRHLCSFIIFILLCRPKILPENILICCI